LQIEDTILLREIESRAVQFAAMRQTGSKVSLSIKIAVRSGTVGSSGHYGGLGSGLDESSY
jgi:hypothetical protein